MIDIGIRLRSAGDGIWEQPVRGRSERHIAGL